MIPRNVKDITELAWVTCREIRPEDWPALQRFHGRLSAETVRLRFRGAKRDLSEPLARRLSGVDHKREEAVVAIDSHGEIVGVGRYSLFSPGTAEVAFVVLDGLQSHGVGSTLMAELRRRAIDSGVTTFVAQVVADNTRMLSLMRECGRTRTAWKDGEAEVWAHLEPVAVAAT